MDSENSKPIAPDPLFSFLSIGSLLYALWFTVCLYRNHSGITYPFFIGGTCFFFFCFLKKSGHTARPYAIFDTVSLLLLGISTCCTDAWYLVFLNKWMILILFMHLFIHSFYDDRDWDIFRYVRAGFTTLFSSLAFLFQPAVDLCAFIRSRRHREKPVNRKVFAILIGISVALLMLPLILMLLTTADAVFFNMTQKVLARIPDLLFHTNLFSLLAMFLFAFLSAYCLMERLLHPNLASADATGEREKYDPVIAITFSSIIGVIYLIFCGIQVLYLFAGLGSLPEGYTYAQYAREGFFQLVFISLLNLILILACIRLFKEHFLLRVVLTLLSCCTFIMIASSAYRMLLYIRAYNLTVLRFFVLWGLAVITAWMIGTLIYLFHHHFAFVKYSLTVLTVLYLMLSFAHPDYWIAKYNLQQSAVSPTACDLSYISNLSADAAPAILADAVSIEENMKNTCRQEYLFHLKESLSDPSPLKWNLSRWMAHRDVSSAMKMRTSP